jgi:hypothetical protein
LLVAAYGWHLDAVDALLSAGAPVGRRNANGFNVIDELRDREANASEEEKPRVRSLIERMKNLVVAQASPWRQDETVQFLSFTALKAMEMMEEPRAGDVPEKAAERARIVRAAAALRERWPKAGGPWGIPLSNYGRRAPFRFDEYDNSITGELILLDAEEHSPSTEVLEMTARDLETKFGDCEAGGEDAGPEPKVRFSFTTVKPPNNTVSNYQLVWKNINEIGRERFEPGSTTWHHENRRSPGRVQLVPGTYYMYVQDDNGLHTDCEIVDVGGKADLSKEFHIVVLQDGEGCRKH